MVTNTDAQLPVIIVGGGLAGLSAAALLARAGHAVTLFEKSGGAGGRARTNQQDGFFFNQGAHAFYPHGPGAQVLRELGVRYSGARPGGPGFFVLADDRLYTAPVGATTLLTTRLLPWAAKMELLRLLARLQGMRYAEIREISLGDWLARQVKHEQARRFILATMRLATYSNAPELLSAEMLQFLLHTQVLYLDGGWQTLVDGLEQKAREMGVRIITGARVQAIEVTEDGYRARMADGTSYEAGTVLLATDPKTASALVMDGEHEELRRWADQALPARAACLDLALRRLPRPGNTYTLDLDRPLYYSAHSTWARLAPEGSALVHTMKYLQPGETADPEATRQELEEQMDRLQPGWRAEVVRQYFLPHMIVSNAIVQARLGGLAGRPGPVVPGLPNLYVAGDWVGPEGGLSDASFASASDAARLITARAAGRQDSSMAGSMGVI
ncbi:phytoene desaturase family protein [Dictyobacter aurantiacus]|uniref:Dehydrogenase n=1 Tax=Dictyobacter aurantiacus TaxID=1936993 RepID=A0A401ZJW2_9CHLR|nr:FAD-dependent oxidoreductase [Dictyobacter aurantiacus]GCE07122.1 dehydrogenase [Dictyobacter aurantiacus]